MEYWKINSLWKRQGWYFDQDKKNSPDYQKNRQSFIVGDYACPEYANIKKWRVFEKIDGTNIRIEFGTAKEGLKYLYVMGRTAEAQIPVHLHQHLNATFTTPEAIEKLMKQFPESERVILFGEGYGPKIQSCGGNYADQVGFVLFDVVVGNWVLTPESVKEVSDNLKIPMVSDLGTMTEDEIVSFVKSQPKSLFSKREMVMEGVVCTPEPVMLYRNGHPIKMKLKCKEFICNDLEA